MKPRLRFRVHVSTYSFFTSKILSHGIGDLRLREKLIKGSINSLSPPSLSLTMLKLMSESCGHLLLAC